MQLAMMPALMTRALSLTGLFFSKLGSSLGYFSTSLGSSSGKATKPPKGIARRAYSTSGPCEARYTTLHKEWRRQPWAAQCDTWLLIQLTPEGVLCSFLSKVAAMRVSKCLQYNRCWCQGCRLSKCYTRSWILKTHLWHTLKLQISLASTAAQLHLFRDAYNVHEGCATCVHQAATASNHDTQ